MPAIHEKVPMNEESPAGDDDDDDDDAAAAAVKTDMILISLSWAQAAALLTADCVGVGILALPVDVQELGWVLGLGFLVANLPINYYAGCILAQAATGVEQQQQQQRYVQTTTTTITTPHSHSSGSRRAAEFEMVAMTEEQQQQHSVRQEQDSYSSCGVLDSNDASTTATRCNEKVEKQNVGGSILRDRSHNHHDHQHEDSHNPFHESDGIMKDKDGMGHTGTSTNSTSSPSSSSSTQDLIGITAAIFHEPIATKLVMTLYFGNLFLVLGDYILVMSHAVAAMLRDQICIPTAGILASFLMFALSQLRTMAKLGREATILSLTTLFIVLVQCLTASYEHETPVTTTAATAAGAEISSSPTATTSIWRKFSALASIGFAVGSQKLFLNIRHEMQNKAQAPQTLALSLTGYGLIYIVVVIVAGSDPPAFLFDAIPEGPSRRIAGFLLWTHVAVSYAINSQAICSSLDRQYFQTKWPNHPQRRWLLLTFAMAVSSYTVANAIPFFQDLVSLIGAFTTVPLTLALPALVYRESINVSLWRPSLGKSYTLLLYSLAFLGIGLVGSIYSIDRDWMHKGGPFSCR